MQTTRFALIDTNIGCGPSIDNNEVCRVRSVDILLYFSRGAFILKQLSSKNDAKECQWCLVFWSFKKVSIKLITSLRAVS